MGGGPKTQMIETNAKTTYNYEVGAYRESETDNIKVGLMYVNDFAFAAEPRCWSLPPDEYGTNSERCYDWLNNEMLEDEWTISPVRDGFSADRSAYSVNYPVNGTWGYAFGGTLSYSGIYARPSFYMISSITYNRGTGTSTDPIRIN